MSPDPGFSAVYRSFLFRRFACAAIGLLLSAGLQAQTQGTGSMFSDPGTVIGSGRLRTESRVVSGFQGIAVAGPMNLVLRQGSREGVEVRADDNILPLIDVRVVPRPGVPTLVIGGRSGTSFMTRNEITVTVDVQTLRELAMNGSGSASAQELKGDRLKLSLSGSGNIGLQKVEAGALEVGLSGSGNVHAAGRAERLDVAIRGSGNVQAGELAADTVVVNVAGSGNAEVNSRRTLRVSISGSGDVTQVGPAAVSETITGSGSVTRR